MLKSDDERSRQLGRGVRREQQVRAAEVEDQLHTTVWRDVTLDVARKARFMDPKALDALMKERVWLEFEIFHIALATHVVAAHGE